MKELYAENPAMFRNHPFWFLFLVLLIPAMFFAVVPMAGAIDGRATALVIFCGIVLDLLALLVWYIRCKASRLSVTEENVLYEVGILSKTRYEMDIDQIRTVVVSQSFVNRIFGVGQIAVFTTGDNPEVVVPGLPNPNRVRELIKTNRDD